MSSSIHIFDRTLLAYRRDRAAAGIDQHDFLLEHVAADLIERLGAVNRRFTRALVLGADNGHVGNALLRCCPDLERLVSADASPRLLARSAGLRVVADEEALPFAEAAFDLIVAPLGLQLVNDLPGTLLQLRRCLSPDGLLLAALLGGDTLGELRQAFLAAESEVEGGASPRVAPFADVRDLGALLQRAGLALPVADADTLTVTYATPLALMRELKAMGAGNVLTARRRQPLRRETLARAASIYQQRFGLPDGRIPATFEIITLTGWAPHGSQQQPLRPGSAVARLADALATRELPGGDPAGGPDQAQ